MKISINTVEIYSWAYFIIYLIYEFKNVDKMSIIVETY